MKTQIIFFKAFLPLVILMAVLGGIYFWHKQNQFTGCSFPRPNMTTVEKTAWCNNQRGFQQAATRAVSSYQQPDGTNPVEFTANASGYYFQLFWEDKNHQNQTSAYLVTNEQKKATAVVRPGYVWTQDIPGAPSGGNSSKCSSYETKNGMLQCIISVPDVIGPHPIFVIDWVN